MSSASATAVPAEREGALRGLRVRDAMVRQPKVLGASASIADVRRLFRDEHVHLALLVEAGRLVSAIERADLAASDPAGKAASSVGSVAGRSVAPDTPLRIAAESLACIGRRRLAVVDASGQLLGLLCLKASGKGFCSEDDVRERRESRPAELRS